MYLKLSFTDRSLWPNEELIYGEVSIKPEAIEPTSATRIGISDICNKNKGLEFSPSLAFGFNDAVFDELRADTQDASYTRKIRLEHDDNPTQDVTLGDYLKFMCEQISQELEGVTPEAITIKVGSANGTLNQEIHYDQLG